MESNKETAIQVLIVDDDLNVIDDVIKCIHSLDKNVKPAIADDPGKALELIKSGTFYDIIIVDYIFSGFPITGLEIFQEIKKVYRGRVYVGVLITSWGTAELFVREQAADFFSEYIEKPFSAFDNLKEKINKVISLLQRRRAEDRQEADKQEPGK